MADMKQNEALANKTVYSKDGLNVHYDFLGYAVWAENPNSDNYKNTTKSVHAQPIDEALAGKEWKENWTGLVDWNFGEPDYSKVLTEENELAARKAYYLDMFTRDYERRGQELPEEVRAKVEAMV